MQRVQLCQEAKQGKAPHVWYCNSAGSSVKLVGLRINVGQRRFPIDFLQAALLFWRARMLSGVVVARICHWSLGESRESHCLAGQHRYGQYCLSIQAPGWPLPEHRLRSRNVL